MGSHSPEAISEVEERGPRVPPEEAATEADADDGGASDSLTSAVLGAKTTGESVGFVPIKSWKTGFTNCWLAR